MESPNKHHEGRKKRSSLAVSTSTSFPGPLGNKTINSKSRLPLSNEARNAISYHQSTEVSDEEMVILDDDFSYGPWIDMCTELQIPRLEGMPYGGFHSKFYETTVQQVIDLETGPKVNRLLVLIKWVKRTDNEMLVTLHDPTGDIEGYFHRSIVDEYGPTLVVGTGLVLSDVSLLITDSKKLPVLNIVPRNLERIFCHGSQIIDKPCENHTNNNENNPCGSSQKGINYLKECDVNTASRDLHMLSQKMVVDRNPPTQSIWVNTRNDGLKQPWDHLLEEGSRRNQPSIEPLCEYEESVKCSIENSDDDDTVENELYEKFEEEEDVCSIISSPNLPVPRRTSRVEYTPKNNGNNTSRKIIKTEDICNDEDNELHNIKHQSNRSKVSQALSAASLDGIDDDFDW